jgi:hypothetical protein
MGRVKNCKAKGTRLELRTMKVLEAQGYACSRSAASLGEWDVIAIGQDVRLIQVKANRRPGSVEMTRLRDFHAPPGCIKEIWIWKDGKPKDPLIEVI